MDQARSVSTGGLDLALQMLLVARRRTGNRNLACGDMRSAPFVSGSIRAVVAFWSIHHLPRLALRTALIEIRSLLKPAGLFVVATHLGESDVYSSEFLGHQITPVGGTLYGNDELLDELGASRLWLKASAIATRFATSIGPAGYM